MTFTVDIEGMEQANKNLSTLVREMAAENQLEAMEEGASVLQKAASLRAPVSAGPPTRGARHLKEAIDIAVRDRRKNKVKLAVGPGKEQYHGIFFELGTIDMPAQPFLRPAADEQGKDAINVVRAALAFEVAETAIKLRGSI